MGKLWGQNKKIWYVTQNVPVVNRVVEFVDFEPFPPSMDLVMYYETGLI